MPARPLLLYDGDCDFCAVWIARWKRVTGDRVEYAPYQQAAEHAPQVERGQFREAVHLIEPDGRISRGAEAVFRSLALVPGRERWLRLYLRAPLFARASEWTYRAIARHRGLLGRLSGIRPRR